MARSAPQGRRSNQPRVKPVDPESLIPVERIAAQIYRIRGENVMLDADLASLYGVETRVLVQAVKRNLDRFPEDFMFQLSKAELEDWRSQIVMSNPAAKMSLRRRPYAFTEHGVAMLASVLRSKRAIDVNIAIVRTFIRLRRMLATNEELARKVAQHDQEIAILFDHIKRLLEPPEPPKNRQIGFAAGRSSSA
jgi:hypothetical protein